MEMTDPQRTAHEQDLSDRLDYQRHVDATMPDRQIEALEHLRKELLARVNLGVDYWISHVKEQDGLSQKFWEAIAPGIREGVDIDLTDELRSWDSLQEGD